MKKYLAVFLFAGLLLSGCKIFGQSNVLSEGEGNLKVPNEVSDEERVQDSQYYTDALSSKNSLLCENIKDLEVSKNCLAAVVMKNAVEASDVQICEQISDVSKKSTCEEKVNFEKNNDPTN